MEKFCDRLKQLREEAGISMKQLADNIEVSDAAVCKWENGNAEPKVSYLIKLAEFFDCTVDYLVGKTDDYSVSNTETVNPFRLTSKEKQLVNSFRELNPDMKTLIMKTLNAWNKPDN